MFRRTILILFLATYGISLNSQVTIGNAEPPAQGALLQLKNIGGVTGGGINSTKGLGLPRVKLTKIGELKDISGTTDGEKAKHTGLVVYNTNLFCDNDKMHYPGLYVWDGTIWNPLNENDDFVKGTNRVWITENQDGHTFRAARFGDQIWMVDNLSARKYDSESGVTETLPLVPNGVVEIYDNISLGYPAPSPAPNPLPAGSTGAQNGTDTYYYDNFKEYGVLYTWMAATGSTSSIYHKNQTNYVKVDQQTKSLATIGANEVERVESKGYIQGICPNGWHLPSDREWTMLTKEIFENVEKYSYITKEEREAWVPNTWSDVVHPLNVKAVLAYINTGSNKSTSNLALAFKRSCDVAFAPSIKLKNGRGFLASDGGFNMIPAGSLYATSVIHYGRMAKYWTSSMAYLTTAEENVRKALARYTFFDDDPNFDSANSLAKEVANTYDYCSVRCIYHGGEFKEGMPESWRDLF